MHAPQMSEMAFLHMLVLARNYARMLDNQRSATWERWPQPLYRKTIVILGGASRSALRGAARPSTCR